MKKILIMLVACIAQYCCCQCANERAKLLNDIDEAWKYISAMDYTKAEQLLLAATSAKSRSRRACASVIDVFVFISATLWRSRAAIPVMYITVRAIPTRIFMPEYLRIFPMLFKEKNMRHSAAYWKRHERR
jgi:hypothetical protein